MTSGAGHAGDLTPEEAFDLLNSSPKAVLIDVRTEPEWTHVGVPDAAGLPAPPLFIEWLLPPTMTPNPDFATRLQSELQARGADETTPLLFLCRSGARSAAAAVFMTARGYTQCHNVTGGFEGSPAMGSPGWARSGLPSTRG